MNDKRIVELIFGTLFAIALFFIIIFVLYWNCPEDYERSSFYSKQVYILNENYEYEFSQIKNYQKKGEKEEVHILTDSFLISDTEIVLEREHYFSSTNSEGLEIRMEID